MVPLQVFPWYPPTGLRTYRVLLPRSLAFTITLVLIRTVVVVVVVVNINLLPVTERRKLLILLAVPEVLAVILLELPAVLAVLLLVLLVLLTSQSSDQLHGNRVADQRFGFRYLDSTNSLLDYTF